MTRLPLEGYREKCLFSTTILGGGRGIVENPLELKDSDLYRIHVFWCTFCIG